MEIIVFAKVFSRGTWGYWEHKCTWSEVERVVDSARVKASDRLHLGPPLPIDYLGGVRYIFDVARGTLDKPKDGDSVVYGANLNGLLIQTLEQLRQDRRIA